MKRADSLLAPLIKNLKIEDAVRLNRIKEGWQGIFEKPLTLHMFPAALKEGEILINVDSPAWLQQLSFYKGDIIRKLQVFGIRSVRFRIGRVYPEKKKEMAAPKTRALTDDERSFADNTVSTISDSELKHVIKSAIEKSISLLPQRQRD